MFHLFTHAFFKALLFLSAGSVMHAMGDVIDMRRFSGLRKRAADDALGRSCAGRGPGGRAAVLRLLEQGRDPGRRGLEATEASRTYGKVYACCSLSGLFTAGLTAFYTFRAYFLTFWGEEKIPHEAGHHAHESPAVMTVPLLVLSLFAVGVGLVVGADESVRGLPPEDQFHRRSAA